MQKQPFNVIVAGGRDFASPSLLAHTLNRLLLPDQYDYKFLCGMATGADSLGYDWASDNNYPIKTFPARWRKYGKSAGYRRNVEMAQEAHGLIAFWDGQSRGTKHMIDIAQTHGLIVHVIRY